MKDKNAYYLTITSSQFLSGKELLKSMPMFYNKVYFTRPYANTIWNGESNDTFANITMICNIEDMELLRNIIRNNFLYIRGWDSLAFNSEDYGFSFIGGNIKYVLIGYIETETGYVIKSYDADTGMCYDTELKNVDKNFFLDVSMSERNEIVRTCQFDIADINEENTKKHLAEKKVQPAMAHYDSGFAIADTKALMAIALLASVVTWCTYIIMKFLT